MASSVFVSIVGSQKKKNNNNNNKKIKELETKNEYKKKKKKMNIHPTKTKRNFTFNSLILKHPNKIYLISFHSFSYHIIF